MLVVAVVLIGVRAVAADGSGPCTALSGFVCSIVASQIRSFTGNAKDGEPRSFVGGLAFSSGGTPTVDATIIENKNGTPQSATTITGGSCAIESTTNIGIIDFTGNFALSFVITNGGTELLLISNPAVEPTDNKVTIGTCSKT